MYQQSLRCLAMLSLTDSAFPSHHTCSSCVCETLVVLQLSMAMLHFWRSSGNRWSRIIQASVMVILRTAKKRAR